MKRRGCSWLTFHLPLFPSSKTHNMKNKHLPFFFSLVLTTLSLGFFAQNVPVAGFSISPNPVCVGQIIQITDVSTNLPNAWSYTIRPVGIGPGPGAPTVVTVQNPTVVFPNPGTFSISLVATNGSGSSTVYTQTLTVLQSPNVNITPANPSSCAGGAPVNITVSTGGGPGGGTLTYSWSTGATTNTISVSPSVTTIYTCVITSTSGCSSIRTSTVTIGTPTITVNSVPANICPGSSSTLTATGSGPVPITYTWSTGSNMGSITTSVPGVYTASLTNGQGCVGIQSYTLGTSTTLSLTVASNPSILCAGNTATLNVSGASSYTWSNNSNSVNPTVNPTSTSSYTVSGSIGTCTGSAVLTLSVNTIPTINIASTANSVCAGTTVTLSASGANTYTWLPSNVNTTSITASPSSNVTYTARGINPGCPARNATITINVLPSPNISVSSSASMACAGDVVALAASGSANSYSWSNGSSSAIIIITPSVTTTYTVTGLNTNNCSAKAVITQSVTDCTGLSNQVVTGNQLSVYPNPSNGVVNIISPTNLQLSLLDLAGRCFIQINLSAEVPVEINTNDLPAGIYYFNANNQVLKQKLVILK